MPSYLTASHFVRHFAYGHAQLTGSPLFADFQSPSFSSSMRSKEVRSLWVRDWVSATVVPEQLCEEIEDTSAIKKSVRALGNFSQKSHRASNEAGSLITSKRDSLTSMLVMIVMRTKAYRLC